MNPVDAALAVVLAHPHFARHTRAELLNCDAFCAAVRSAPHDAVVELQEPLEEIAFATNDHNEAAGFLQYFVTVGGGFDDGTGDTASAGREVPLESVTDFMAWAVAQPPDARA